MERVISTLSHILDGLPNTYRPFVTELILERKVWDGKELVALQELLLLCPHSIVFYFP